MEGILLAKEVCLAPELHLLRERALRDRWGSWERRGKPVASVMMPDICWSRGISEAQKIAQRRRRTICQWQHGKAEPNYHRELWAL